MRNIILFDLDGTLTDPMEGITKSVQHALKAYGIIEEDLTKLCPFIGPPLKESFIEFYGFSDQDAQDAISVFREYFTDKGIFENKVYPGIEKMLISLNEAGALLAVATSKPEHFAESVLEHFNLRTYFHTVGGADMEEIRVKKGDIIKYTLEKIQVEHGDHVVMVGDRKHDIIGAKEADIPGIGVLYGYGDREELLEAGAVQIAETVETLRVILLEDARS